MTKREMPNQGNQMFITDGGLETTLIFLDEIELPGFSAIHMMQTEKRQVRLKQYFEEYLKLSKEVGAGFLLESPTWRSSHGWSSEIEIPVAQLDDMNRRAIEMMLALRDQYESASLPIVVSGCIGPREDGYNPSTFLSIGEAQHYHSQQIAVLAESGVDCISALTMSYVEEAIGITLAARDLGLPCVISFTVETDGKLITGQTLEEAIKAVEAATDNCPAYYMVNCAHPTHFAESLDATAGWVKRVGGIRANASACSHEELDNAITLDSGNPEELASQYHELLKRLPHLRVFGGCCGTDVRHIREIAELCLSSSSRAA